MIRIFLGLFCIVSVCSCKKESASTEIPTDTSLSRVLVLCEGNYTWGNATLDEYLPELGKLNSNVYSKINDNLPLGDVLQSGLAEKNDLWLVVNNSGKIERLNPASYKRKGTVTGLQSPRYIARVNDSILWCTDLYSSQLYVINTHTMKVTATLPTSGRTEQILEVNGQMWNTAFKTGLEVRNKATGKVEENISLKTGAQWLLEDANGTVWVLCSDSNRSVLYAINSVSKKNEKSFNLPVGKFATRLCKSQNSDTIYWLSDGLYSMPINGSNLPTEPALKLANVSFYGLDVNPTSGDIYLSNPKDYVAAGKVYVFSSQLKFKTEFTTGIIPGGFLFYK